MFLVGERRPRHPDGARGGRPVLVSDEAGVEDGPPLGRQTALAESLQRPPNVELSLERRWIEDRVGRRDTTLVVRELHLQAAAGVVDGLVARHHPQPGRERPPVKDCRSDASLSKRKNTSCTSVSRSAPWTTPPTACATVSRWSM
jgi:hypothetical protein